MTETAQVTAPSCARRLVGRLGIAAVVVGVVAYPAAWLVDRVWGRDVIALQADPDAAQIEVSQATFDDTLKGAERLDAIVDIYGGTPRRPPVAERYLFVPEGEVVHPKEDPSLSLLRARQGGGYRYQSKSLLFLAAAAAVGALAGGVALLVLRRFLR